MLDFNQKNKWTQQKQLSFFTTQLGCYLIDWNQNENMTHEKRYYKNTLLLNIEDGSEPKKILFIRKDGSNIS
jgi:hypothetical protein